MNIPQLAQTLTHGRTFEMFPICGYYSYGSYNIQIQVSGVGEGIFHCSGINAQECYF